MLVPSCLIIGALNDVRFMEWGFLLAAWVGVLWNLFLKSNYGENATPFVGVGLLGAMALSNRFTVPKFLYGGIFIVSFVYLVSGLPKIDPDFREALWQTATCVRSLVSEEEMILTPFPIVAVEADRRVPRDMTMGLFALTSEIEPGRARRLHLTSTQELLG